MTVHRFPDRTKHQGPYYGYELRDMLRDEPRDRSHELRWVACCVIVAAIGLAAMIVGYGR